MALAKVVDVQPDEHGYDFLHADGASTYLPRSPETDAYAQQVQQFKDQNYLAMNDAAPSGGAPVATDAPASVMSAAPAPEPMMSVAPPPPPPPVDTAPMMTPATGPVVAPEGAPAAPPAPGPDPLGELALRAAMTRGSPAVTRQQLAQKAASGVAVPTTASTTVEGAMPYDEQAEAERAAAREQIRQARSAHAEANVYAAQDEAVALQNQADAINAQISPARQRLAAIEAGVKADETSYRQLRAKVADGQVDPNRIFRGPVGALAAIASAIGQAFGARGAILGHSQNFAQQIMQSAIDRDVQAQEDDFRRQGMAADNMFRDLMMHYQDADQARTALRGMQLEQAKTLAAYTVSRAKSQDAQLAFNDWQAQDLFDESEGERKIREQSYGKMTARTEAAMQYPHAAVAPRIDNQRAFENALKAGTARREDATSAIGIEKGRAETELTRAKAAAGAKGGQIPRTLMPSANAADSTLKLARGLLKDYGVKEGQDVGRVEGWGVGLSKDTTGKSARDIESNLMTLFDEHYKMITGNGPTESDKQEFQHRISSWSTAQKVNFANQAIDQAKHKQDFIESQRGAGEPLNGGEGDVELTPK